ncbi:MAG: hypothetical protein RR483_02675 [Clostridia bacterium]
MKNKKGDTNTVNNIIKLKGNETKINTEKEIIPGWLMNAGTESMDDIDGNGPPIISDQNVLLAKDFVDENHK